LTHSLVQLGGLAGALLCGVTADSYFQGALDLFCLLFSFCLPLSLLVLPSPATALASDMDTFLPVFALAFFFIVAAINGPKTLIGIAIREIVPPESAGIASGAVGVIGQLGSTLAGSGIASCLFHFGWDSYLLILYIASGIASLLYWISYHYCSSQIPLQIPGESLKKNS
jgi:sugar phosphate permease